YIFEKGWLGDQVTAALIRAARRGIRVRLLVDGIGSSDFAGHYGPRLQKAGIPFHVYRSWPTFFSSILHRFHFIRPLKFIRFAGSTWDSGKHRDHRKQCIVDGTHVWIGSFNVSDWHLERIKGKATWRDTGISLSGVKSQVFGLAFQIAWEDAWPRHFARQYRHALIQWLSQDVQGSPIRMTVGRKLRRLFRKELLARGANARRIWVLTPYFIPTGPLLRALGRAAKRGCDVCLILPGQSDVPMVRWASMTYYPMLLKAGCRIFEFQNRVLHGKTTLLDSWALVGSSNLDSRSLRKDLEVNVIPQEKKSLRMLERQYQLDLRQSREIRWEEMRQRPWWARFLSAVFFKFRYWF
ncbi:MAG TPA: phospholipase D-like domain-containing protein, partial [bacterium]